MTLQYLKKKNLLRYWILKILAVVVEILKNSDSTIKVSKIIPIYSLLITVVEENISLDLHWEKLMKQEIISWKK